MKKTLTSLLALLLAGVMVFPLTACTVTGGESESTFELAADGKEDSLKLLNEFFADTCASDNLVVVTKQGDALRYTETIVGDAGSVVFAESGVTTYSFKQDGALIGASDDGENKTYRKGEGAYSAYYRFFYARIRALEYAENDDSAFSCVTKTEEKETADGKTSTAELTFEMTGENGVKITATARDGLVQSATVTDDAGTVTQTYVYGSASVTPPDLTDWEDVTSEPSEENQLG